MISTRSTVLDCLKGSHMRPAAHSPSRAARVGLLSLEPSKVRDGQHPIAAPMLDEDTEPKLGPDPKLVLKLTDKQKRQPSRGRGRSGSRETCRPRFSEPPCPE